MEVLSITNKAGGAREIRRSRVEAGGDHLIGRRWAPIQKSPWRGVDLDLNLPHHQVGTHPKVTMEGSRP